MTEKHFTIDIEETHQKNAIWEFDKSIDDYQFVCWEGDCDSLVGKLNELADENKQLKSDCDYRWKKYCNTRKEMLHENEQLKKENNHIHNINKEYREENLMVKEECIRLREENEELKQRNENQYNQLNQLWKLIKAKDWETLTELDNLMEEF